MKKKTLIAIGLVVSMLASTATAFAGTAGTSEYIINENGQRVWVEDDATEPTGTSVNTSKCGTYTKSPVKEYLVSTDDNGTMSPVKEDPEITGSHNGKLYIIVYEDGAQEYIRNGKSERIKEPSTTPTTPDTGSENNPPKEYPADAIFVKSCPTQAEIKAYVKAHPFTDNKVNWDKVSYKVRPNPENGVVGELSDRSIEQYKNYLNFARYCAGLPEITINKEASKKAQCAAALTYLNYKNKIFEAHYPTTRPAGLTDEQWEVGKIACANSSIAPSLNSYKSPVATCQAFLQDETKKIGHRVDELGYARQMGVGFVNGTAAEYYEDETSPIVNSEYFTFPSENFPVELMQKNGGQIIEAADGMYNFPWSVHLGDNYSISDKNNLKVVFNHSRYGTKTMTYSGSAESRNMVSYSKGAVYFTPIYDASDDSEYLYRSFDIGDKCTVTLTGIEKNGKPATIKYTTTLFSVFGYDPIYGNKDNDNEDDPAVDPTEPTKPSISKPAKVIGVKAKAGKKQMTVSWKKAKNAKGYQVTYAANKSFKAAKNMTTTKTTAKLKKLKSKKTYYAKVRAYRKANGKTLYGGYSNVVKQKIK